MTEQQIKQQEVLERAAQTLDACGKENQAIAVRGAAKDLVKLNNEVADARSQAWELEEPR